MMAEQISFGNDILLETACWFYLRICMALSVYFVDIDVIIFGFLQVVGQRAGFNVTNERELAVLAGTGNYLGQKGYAVVSTVSQTLVPGSIIGAQYNIQKWTLVVGKAD